MTDAELLPCPFCGGEAQFSQLNYGVIIRCQNRACFVCLESFHKGPAIQKWNTRISQQSKIDVDEVEKLLNLYAIELKEEYYNEEILNKFLTQEKTNEIKININFRVGKMVEETRHRIGYTTEQLTKK